MSRFKPDFFDDIFCFSNSGLIVYQICTNENRIVIITLHCHINNTSTVTDLYHILYILLLFSILYYQSHRKTIIIQCNVTIIVIWKYRSYPHFSNSDISNCYNIAVGTRQNEGSSDTISINIPLCVLNLKIPSIISAFL